MGSQTWSPERVAIAKAYMERGLSGLQSSEAFMVDHGIAVTRNAIIGIWNRQGWQSQHRRKKLTQHERRLRNEEYNQRRRILRGESHTHKPKSRIQLEEFRNAEVTPRHIGLLDLTSQTCRYPYGEGPFTFCGCETAKGEAGESLSYCAPHQRLCHGYHVMTVEELAQHRTNHRRRFKAELLEANP